MFSARPPGEEAAVPDAMEAAGEHMKQEAAYELVDGKRHDLEALAPCGGSPSI
jgi:hypothetical protein